MRSIVPQQNGNLIDLSVNDDFPNDLYRTFSVFVDDGSNGGMLDPRLECSDFLGEFFFHLHELLCLFLYESGINPGRIVACLAVSGILQVFAVLVGRVIRIAVAAGLFQVQSLQGLVQLNGLLLDAMQMEKQHGFFGLEFLEPAGNESGFVVSIVEQEREKKRDCCLEDIGESQSLTGPPGLGVESHVLGVSFAGGGLSTVVGRMRVSRVGATGMLPRRSEVEVVHVPLVALSQHRAVTTARTGADVRSVGGTSALDAVVVVVCVFVGLVRVLGVLPPAAAHGQVGVLGRGPRSRHRRGLVVVEGVGRRRSRSRPVGKHLPGFSPRNRGADFVARLHDLLRAGGTARQRELSMATSTAAKEASRAGQRRLGRHSRTRTARRSVRRFCLLQHRPVEPGEL